MTIDGEKDARLAEIPYILAAKKVRYIIETFVVPRVGHVLSRTLDGEPAPGCTHLVDAPGHAPAAATIDWMCEGVGLLCRDCSIIHLSDERTPHRDARHEVCIVCGYRSDDLSALTAPVRLRQPLMVTSEALNALSEIQGERMARAYVGSVVTTPITWECPRHDGFHDSRVELHWPS